MAKFKNLIVENGSFGFGDKYIDFKNPFETKDKDLITHLKSRSDWEEVKEEINSNEGNKTSGDSLESKNKAQLVEIAKELKIETKGLNKDQIIEAINVVKSGENGIDLNDIDLEAQVIEDLITLAQSLEIKTEGLNKEELIAKIEEIKTESDDL